MFPARRMISAVQIVLHIADHGVDPLEDPAAIISCAAPVGLRRESEQPVEGRLPRQQCHGQGTPKGDLAPDVRVHHPVC